MSEFSNTLPTTLGAHQCSISSKKSDASDPSFAGGSSDNVIRRRKESLRTSVGTDARCASEGVRSDMSPSKRSGASSTRSASQPGCVPGSSDVSNSKSDRASNGKANSLLVGLRRSITDFFDFNSILNKPSVCRFVDGFCNRLLSLGCEDNDLSVEMDGESRTSQSSIAKQIHLVQMHWSDISSRRRRLLRKGDARAEDRARVDADRDEILKRLEDVKEVQNASLLRRIFRSRLSAPQGENVRALEMDLQRCDEAIQQCERDEIRADRKVTVLIEDMVAVRRAIEEIFELRGSSQLPELLEILAEINEMLDERLEQSEVPSVSPDHSNDTAIAARNSSSGAAAIASCTRSKSAPHLDTDEGRCSATSPATKVVSRSPQFNLHFLKQYEDGFGGSGGHRRTSADSSGGQSNANNASDRSSVASEVEISRTPRRRTSGSFMESPPSIQSMGNRQFSGTGSGISVEYVVDMKEWEQTEKRKFFCRRLLMGFVAVAVAGDIGIRTQ